MRIEWSPAARASARRYMADQDGMRMVGSVVAALAVDPDPPDAFIRGDPPTGVATGAQDAEKMLNWGFRLRHTG